MDMKAPKGRNTIRRGGSVTGATGQTSRMIKRWRFDPKPDTTLARLEAAYMSGLDAVDRIEERAAINKTSGKFTREGARDDVLRYALNELVPGLHKARMAIRRARAEVAERRSKLKIEGPDKSDVAAAFRRMEARTFLREMKDAEQLKYFARYGDDQPSEVAAAVLQMPPRVISGSQRTAPAPNDHRSRSMVDLFVYRPQNASVAMSLVQTRHASDQDSWRAGDDEASSARAAAAGEVADDISPNEQAGRDPTTRFDVPGIAEASDSEGSTRF